MKPALSFRLLLAVALFPLLAAAQTAVAPTGRGTARDPYRVASLENLYWLSQHPESWTSHFRQTADIDAGATQTWNEASAPGEPDSIVEGFPPIGSRTTVFRGTYDGQGRVITGLHIRRPLEDDVGLFRRTGRSARLYNVRLVGAHVVGRHRCGALAGSNDTGLVHSSHVSDSRIQGQDSVGGLIGRHGGGNLPHRNTIAWSSALGNEVRGRYVVGGLVGAMADTILGCRTSGTVTGTSGVGGVVGQILFTGRVRWCASLAQVSLANQVPGGLYHAGGLVGASSWGGQIRASLAAGLVSRGATPSVGYNYTGGIMGVDHAPWDASVLDSLYWDSAATGQKWWEGMVTIDEDSSSRGRLNATQARTQASYVGWDFEKIWTISPGQYPTLRDTNRSWQQILFDTLGTRPVGAAAIDPQAEASSGLPVVYTSSDTTVAKIVGGKVFPVGAGQVRITAHQDGDARFRAADTVGQVLTVVPPPPRGSGTSADPYRISSFDDLKWLSMTRDAWDKNFWQVAEINAAAPRNWNCGQGFSPIGDVATPFRGAYRGHGHRITGLWIDAPDTMRRVGMFGVVAYGAQVDSLGLINGSVRCGNAFNRAHAACGGVVGENRGTVLHSYFTGRVESRSIYYDTIGGLVGSNRGVIRSCFSAGHVRNAVKAGGLVGMNAPPVAPTGWNRSLITNSYSSARVWALASESNGIGGLVGDNLGGDIQFCYATGEVAAKYWAGGLAGRTVHAGPQYSAITRSYAAVSMTESRDTIGPQSALGSFVGQLYTSSIQSSYVNRDVAGPYSACDNLVGTNVQCDVSGRTTASMKKFTNLDGMGSFDTTWIIRRDTTYPGLRGIDNAPFAFNDSLHAGPVVRISAFVRNDWDIETGRAWLVAHVDSVNGGTTDSSRYVRFPQGAAEGTKLRVVYRVGHIREEGDTLWGNRARAVVVLQRRVPEILAQTISVLEDGGKTIFLLADTAVSYDSLQWTVLNYPSRGSEGHSERDDYLTYIAYSDSFGLDSMRIAVGSAVGRDTAWIPVSIAPVNDAPSFVVGGNRSAFSEDGAFEGNWASSISRGPRNEASQRLGFRVEARDPSLFAVLPAIDAATGRLTFTPAPDKAGETWVRVRLGDDGGTGNGGVDSSSIDSLQVTIWASRSISLTIDGANDLTYGERGTSFQASHPYGLPVRVEILDTTVATIDGDSIRPRNAGRTTITATSPYAGSISYSIRVWQRTLSIMADGGGKTYGEADPPLTYKVYSSLVAGDTLTGAPARVPGEDAGTYTIGKGSFSAGPNYSISFNLGYFVIQPKQVVLLGLQVADKVYDGTNIAPVSGGSLSGVIPGDDVALFPGTARFANASVETSKGITLDGMRLTGSDSMNYSLAVPGDLRASITPRPLTVAADALSKTYGEADPVLTYAHSGLVAGDSLTGMLVRDSGPYPGNYTIHEGTLFAGGNYRMQFTTAEFTIRHKAVTLSGVTAMDKVYDGHTLAKLTGGTLSGVLPGDSVVFVPGEARFTDASAGIGKSVKVVGSRLGGPHGVCYVFPGEPTDLSASITPKSISVKATAASKLYGEPDPALRWMANGLVYPDKLSGSLVRAPGENAGTYAIGVGSLSAGGNYTMSFTGAEFLIEPKTLSVTADAQSKVRGAEDPALTWKADGLIGSDALSGALSREPGEEPGQYAIGQGSLSAGNNYELEYTGSFLTIETGPVALERDPARGRRSTALALDLPEAFATQPTGTGAGRLEPGVACASPDECLSVDLLLPGAATVRVAIYDRLGVPVIAWSGSFTKNDLRRLGAGADGRVRVPFRWNLRAQNGAAVAPGIYLWHIEARTQDGQELEEVKKTGVK